MRAAAATVMAAISVQTCTPVASSCGPADSARFWSALVGPVALSPPTPMTCRPTTCRPRTCRSSPSRSTTCRPTTCRPTTCPPTTCRPSSSPAHDLPAHDLPDHEVAHQQVPVHDAAGPGAAVPGGEGGAGGAHGAGVEGAEHVPLAGQLHVVVGDVLRCRGPASSEPSPVDRGQVWLVERRRALGRRGRRRARRRPGRPRRRPASPRRRPRSSALTWSGVRSGRLCSSSATAPETTAAACEDPLPLKKRLSDPGARVRLVDVGARVAQRDDRPAGRDQVDPPAGVAAAAEVGHDVVAGADGALGVRRRRRRGRTGRTPGCSAAGLSVPLLPPATTTTMPARQAFSTAWVSGSIR